MHVQSIDIVRRNDLFDFLKEILDEDEIHMTKIPVENVKLTLRVGKNLGNKATTHIRVPQGDYLTPTFFIINLAATLRQTKNIKMPKDIKDNDYKMCNMDHKPPRNTRIDEKRRTTKAQSKEPTNK